jgi:hypothetical protein
MRNSKRGSPTSPEEATNPGREQEEIQQVAPALCPLSRRGFKLLPSSAMFLTAFFFFVLSSAGGVGTLQRQTLKG